ncbi:hypothetical protein SUGI_0505320 [Cryptomeria japonica]|nr:hypothetical protein SUGI_0505320 [Cryptomeria japonica]
MSNLICGVYGNSGEISNNEAEIRALEAGLSMCVKKNISKVIIEGDSQDIINGVIQSSFHNWRLYKWLPCINSLLARIGVFEIIHTYREGNRVADLLANMGVERDNQFCSIKLDDVSQELMEAIRKDIPCSSRQGILCMNCEETLERQCIALFNADEDIYEAILEMVDTSLNLERHWCDGFIYEVVLVSIMDVLESKERCVEILRDFVNEDYGDAVAEALCELQKGVKERILKVYFNPTNYYSLDTKEESEAEGDQTEDEEDSNIQDLNDSDEEREERVQRAMKRRKRKFVKEAWSIFRDGVLNGDLIGFKQLKCAKDWWLTEASSDTLFNLGELISQLLHFLRNG